MHWYEITVDLIGKLAWPGVLALFVILQRKPIGRLVDAVRELKAFGAEAKLAERVADSVKQSVRESTALPAATTERTAPPQGFLPAMAAEARSRARSIQQHGGWSSAERSWEAVNATVLAVATGWGAAQHPIGRGPAALLRGLAAGGGAPALLPLADAVDQIEELYGRLTRGGGTEDDVRVLAAGALSVLEELADVLDRIEDELYGSA